jgi:hypothetical protein
MKTTTFVCVSALASVMATGCGATSDDDFDQQASEQEDIGSVEQAVTPAKGDWVVIGCNLTQTQMQAILGDLTAATSVKMICGFLTSTTKIPVLISGVSRTLYNSNGTVYATNRKFWYGVIGSSLSTTLFNNAAQSCLNPYKHRFFTGTFNTNSGCKAAGGASKYYDDFSSTTRTNECNWVKAQTAFKNKAASLGKTIASNCSNVIGFDPGVTSASCSVGGWTC